MKKYICALFVLTGALIHGFESQYHYSPKHHSIVSIEYDGSSIMIEDESVWRVDRLQRNEVRRWRNDDIVVVSPNNSPFSGHKYYLTNMSLDVYIEVDLELGPKYANPYTLVINYVDPKGGVVQVQDDFGNAFTWAIDRADIYRLKNWYPGQHIIVGSNDTWLGRWTSPCEFVIINVEENKHVRAVQR